MQGEREDRERERERERIPCVLIICQYMAWSPRFPSLGLPVQKIHFKMTSSVLRIPVQWNVTLLEITVQVLGTFGIGTVG